MLLIKKKYYSIIQFVSMCIFKLSISYVFIYLWINKHISDQSCVSENVKVKVEQLIISIQSI